MNPADLVAALEEHDWLVVHGPGAASSTAGLARQDLPELVVLGLPPEVGGALLHELAEHLLAGEPVPDEQPLGWLVEGGRPPVLLPVPTPPEMPAVQALGRPVQVRQLVWADDAGRMPWEPGADATGQPLLGPPPLDWPLPDDPHLPVLVSGRVVHDALPVLRVLCSETGDLAFTDGVSDFDPATAVTECLHDTVARDLSLIEAVAPLEPSSVAERERPGTPWRVVPVSPP